MTQQNNATLIPADTATQLRRLSHDLSNALEVILQTSYLLGTVNLDDNGRQWHQMLDQGVQQATSLNRDLREFLHSHSENAAG